MPRSVRAARFAAATARIPGDIFAAVRRLLSSILSSILALATVLGCQPSSPSAAEQQQRSESAATSPEPARRSDAPEFVLAPETGDVAELVAAEFERSRANDRLLLVYVGASWCEPCLYFHAAVDDGTLDESLAGVRLLEFDLDRDRDRLVEAGYSSRMIPLFVAPRPDGRAGARRSEGGIKGPAAVDHLRERLVALVRAARADLG